jgi:WD40 repeat protein
MTAIPDELQQFRDSVHNMHSHLNEVTTAITTIRDETTRLYNIRNQSHIFLLQFEDDAHVLRRLLQDLKSHLAASAIPPSLIPCRPSYTSHPATVHLRNAFQLEYQIETIVFESNGSFFAFATPFMIILMNPATMKIHFTLPIPTNSSPSESLVHTIAVSQDSNFLAINAPSCKVYLYSLRTKSLHFTFSDHSTAVSSLTFSPNSQFLLSGALDGILIIWDVFSLTTIRKILHGPHESINGIAIASDEESYFIVIGFGSGVVGVYESTFVCPIRRFTAHKESVIGISYSKVDDLLATTSKDGLTKIWSLKGLGNLKKILTGHEGFIQSACFAPNSWRLLTASQDGNIRCWECRNDEDVFLLKTERNGRLNIAHHPTEKVFVSAGNENVICLWEYE